MNKILFILLFFSSLTTADETYRDLINQLRSSFFSKSMDVSGLFQYPDEMNEFISLPFSIDKDRFWVVIDGDTIMIENNKNHISLYLNIDYDLSDILRIEYLYDHIHLLFDDEKWNSILDNSRFSFIELNDSVSQLEIAERLDSNREIVVEFNENNKEVYKIINKRDKEILNIITFHVQNQIMENKPYQYRHVFYLLNKNMERFVSQRIKGNTLLPSGHLKGKSFLINNKNETLMLQKYDSGLDRIYFIINPKEADNKLKKVTSSQKTIQLECFSVFSKQTENNDVYIVTTLKRKQIGPVMDKFMKRKSVNYNQEWKFTPGRIVLFVILSSFIIFIFLKTGRIRRK